MLNLDKSTWKTTRFGDVADRVREQIPYGTGKVARYVAGGHFDDSMQITRWGDPSDGGMGSTFTYRFRPGDVLYVSASWYLRKVGVATFEGVTADKTYVIRPRDESVLSPRFLPWILQSDVLHDYAAGRSTGSMNARLLWTALANFELALPDIDEQERIADLLWAVEGYRSSAKLLMKHLQSVSIARINEWWHSAQMTEVGHIGQCVTGSTPSRSRADFWDRRDVPFYTPTQIKGETVSPPEQWVSYEGARRGRLIDAHSVLVACIGGDMGRAAVLDRPAITNQQITAVTGLGGKDGYLLQALLMHPRGRRATAMRETTTVVRKLNKSDLQKVPIPWGDGRHEVSDSVSELRRTVELVKNDLAAQDRLLEAVCDQIFQGSA